MSDRRGAVLLVALFVLTALQLLVVGMLAAAVLERRIVDAHAARLRARLAAETAARHAALSWRNAGVQDLLPGGRRQLPNAVGLLPGNAEYYAEVERISGDRFLIRGVGSAATADGFPARVRVGLIVQPFVAESAAAALGAALAGNGATVLEGGSQLVASSADEPPLGWAESFCPASPVSADATALATPDPALVRIEDAFVESLRLIDAFEGDFVLPGLRWDEIAVLADRVESGSVRAAPVHDGAACFTAAAGNWGNPHDPGGPCGSWFPLIYAAGELNLSGAGQGILVVDGDLILEEGTTFVGVVIVRGRVDARGATVAGALRVQGEASESASRISGSTLTLNRCAVRRALHEAPALSRAFRPRGRHWVPLF